MPIANISLSQRKQHLILHLNFENNTPISVYGNWYIIYVLSQHKHATKYSYQFPLGQINPDIITDYFKQLQK